MNFAYLEKNFVMPQKFCFVWLVFLSGAIHGQITDQTVSDELLDQVAQDVWYPFMQAYHTLDAAQLKSIHAPDILRITIDNNRIDQGLHYLDTFGDYLETLKENRSSLRIAFSIATSAIDAGRQIVHQTGHYRLSSRKAGQDVFVVDGYGYFQVLLKQIDGSWKLVVDADKRVTMDDEAFFSESLVYSLPDE